MSKVAYILIAIAILVALIAIFVISFIAYRRTPAPKGCEDIKPDPELCEQCSKASCAFYKEFHSEIEKEIKEDHKEDNKGDNKHEN